MVLPLPTRPTPARCRSREIHHGCQASVPAAGRSLPASRCINLCRLDLHEPTILVTADRALGFHASGDPSVLLEWLEDTTEQEQFLRRRGFDADFIAHANAVPRNDIWYPTHAEPRAAHVVTATT